MFTPTTCHMSHVASHVSCVMCHVSSVTCQMSHVTCNFFLWTQYFLESRFKVKNKYVNTLFSDLKSRLSYKSTSVNVYYLHQLTPRLYMYDMFFFIKYWLKNFFLIQYMEYLLDQHSSRLDKMPQSLDKTYDNIKIRLIWWLFCSTRPMIVFFFRQLSWKVNHVVLYCPIY